MTAEEVWNRPPQTWDCLLVHYDLFLNRCSLSPSGTDLAATVEVCTNPKCERCWKLLPNVGTIAAHPTLCGRCAEAVG